MRTEFTGAAPSEIETLLTEPVEEAVGVVKNVQRVSSVSRTGQSDVLLEFAWGTDMDQAGLDVREKLELLQLPLQATRPQLLRFDPSTEPIVRLALLADENSGEVALKSLRTHADEELSKRIEPLEGVAAVKIGGGLEDEVQVQLDQQRLGQLGLTVGTVIDRLAQENVNLSGGRVDEGSQRFLVRTLNQFVNLDEMREMVVAVIAGRSVRLKDIATVEAGFKEREAIIRIDGREAVEVAVYKEGDANTVAVAGRIRDSLERLRKELPAGASLELIDDQSRFIESSIAEVVQSALLGGLLAVLTIYLFLGNGWATIVISLSLPVSIIATFFFMQQFGITLNVMSLGGIALATGMVVDNAIVVLENTARLRRQGLGVLEAAVTGASEVGMAITASTLTHIAVFLPLVFVEGIAGQLFRDQALTVTFALLVSLLVALTLIPMLASLEARAPMAFGDKDPEKPLGRVSGVTSQLLATVMLMLSIPVLILTWILKWPGLLVQRGYAAVENSYGKLLPWSLRHRWSVIGIAVLSLVLALGAVRQLGLELIPEFAQGQVTLELKLPPGTPLAYTDRYVDQFQRKAMEIDGIKRVYAVSGSGTRLDANPTESGENIARLLIDLQPSVGRRDEARVLERLRQVTAMIPGADAKFGKPALFSFDTPVEVEVAGFDLDQLDRAGDEVTRLMRANPAFADVKSSVEQGHPEVRIHFDQDKAAALGLTVREVADQVVRKVRGEIATRYSLGDRKIDVLVRSREADRGSVADLRRTLINAGDRAVPLEALAEVTITEGPGEIRRTDQERIARIEANLTGSDLGTAVASLQRQLTEVALPPGVDVRVVGQSEEMARSFNSLLFALGLAVFMVYLVMASQFESLRHPFLILFSVPLALVGAVFSLYLLGMSLSVVVFIGL
ncbi:MAG: efflux RND transporter permease subunit, partial [Xanthomonadales bacterium]|nr:efflux RND transporter permease subunit [Xanthomonadales bacterium]